MIKRILTFLKITFLDSYATKSYAQEGEDLVLRRLLETKKQPGFYVDVGAHHPKRFSNTYYFYKKGWSGINIDAMPGSMKVFRKQRSRDINLEVAVASTQQTLTYFVLNDTALNSFDAELTQERVHQYGYTIVEQIQLKTQPLGLILASHCPPSVKIDYMSVDVEGVDLDVLQSNDWSRFRPRYLLVERLKLPLSELTDDPVNTFLITQDYVLIAMTANTAFYQDLRETNA
jgi:hypothetical protein